MKMIKSFLLSVFVLSSLSADFLNEISVDKYKNERQPQDVSTNSDSNSSWNWFLQGENAYKSKNYKGAVENLKKAYSQYSSAYMQLMWASSEDYLGRDEYAISGYERVMALDSKNIEVALRLIELYRINKQDEDANEVAKSLDKNDLTPKQKAELHALMNKIYEKLYKLNARVSSKIGYDSNIASTPLEGSLNNFASSLELTQEQRDALGDIRGTFFSQNLASLVFTHDLSEKDAWFIKTSLLAMAQFNFDESFYNLQYGKVSLAPGYKFGNYSFLLPLNYGRINYLKQDLLQSYGLSPTFTAIIDSKFMLSIVYEHNEKRYLPKKMKFYNSNVDEVSSTFLYFFGKNYFGTKLLYNSELAYNISRIVTTPKYINHHEIGASLLGMYCFENGIILNGVYEFKQKNYDEKLYSIQNKILEFSDKTRDDSYQNLSFALAKEVYDDLKLIIDYKYTNNSSNYGILNYDKQVVSLGLEYNY